MDNLIVDFFKERSFPFNILPEGFQFGFYIFYCGGVLLVQGRFGEEVLVWVRLGGASGFREIRGCWVGGTFVVHGPGARGARDAGPISVPGTPIREAATLYVHPC